MKLEIQNKKANLSFDKVVKVVIGQDLLDEKISHKVHTQNIASTTWTVVHNLGRKPLFQAFDTAGTRIHGTERHNDNNNEFTITFSTAMSGTVIYGG